MASYLTFINVIVRRSPGLPNTEVLLTGLRHTARLAATHYSTQIESNRLTQARVAEALQGDHFSGWERDETEVRNCYRVLEHV